MSKQNVQFHAGRSAAVVAISVCLVFFCIYSLILKTGLIPGASPEVDAIAAAIQDSEARRITVEGQFLDRDGSPITEPGERGKMAKLLFDEAYSYLIGYNSPIYETSGLRNRLYEDLFYGGDDGIGAEVRLTTINELQEFCYQQIGNHEGSIIIMKADTGELLACASRSSTEMGYNVNVIDQWVDVNGDGEANKEDGQRMYDLYAQYPAFFLNRATMSEDPPGSTFKIITAVSMLENGMKNYTYDDLTGEYEVAGDTVVNVDNTAFGENLDLTKAMVKSANVYFASAAVEMGSKALLTTAGRFLLCEEIELDFATLRPNFSLGNMTNAALLAHTAYGQGETTMAPLHIAMVMGAVLNDGEMMRPGLIASITDDGMVESQFEPKSVSTVMDEQTAVQMKHYLHETAKGYGLTEDAYGMVYAKSGTAELGKSNDNHIYMLAGIEDTSWGDLVVLVDRAHVNAGSSDLKPTLKNILGYLVAN